MEFDEFNKIISNELIKIGINSDEGKNKKIYQYMNMILEWNKKINLTAIKEPKDMILKHFIDSLTIYNYINNEDKIMDLGTGAGFPGIPISIYKDDVFVTLMDSLNKRINFLNEVISELVLHNVSTLCGRAEDLGQDNRYREQYDVVVSRAVAPMNVLLEYMLPFVKVNGKCICMKGPNYKDEILEINNALEKLGGKIEDTIELFTDNNEISRVLIIVRKVEKTNINYPRRAGIPERKPL